MYIDKYRKISTIYLYCGYLFIFNLQNFTEMYIDTCVLYYIGQIWL